jgi:replicative DNA helicase
VPEPPNPERWPELRVALLGHLVGDGSYLRHQPMRYTTNSAENSDLVRRAAEVEFGCRVTRYEGPDRVLASAGHQREWEPLGPGWCQRLAAGARVFWTAVVPETHPVSGVSARQRPGGAPAPPSVGD